MLASENKIEKKTSYSVCNVCVYMCTCLCGVAYVCIWVWVRMHLYWILENCFPSEMNRGEASNYLKIHCFGPNTYIKLTKVCVCMRVYMYVCVCVYACGRVYVCIYLVIECRVRRFYISQGVTLHFRGDFRQLW